MRNALITGALAVLCIIVGPARAQQAGSAMSEQAAHDAAEALGRQFVTDYNAGQAGRLAGLFAEDAHYYTPNGATFRGRREIENALAGRIKAGWTNETVKVLEAHPAGDAVWAVGEYAIAGTGPNSGKRIEGKFAEVLAKEGPDWRFRMLIANIRPDEDVTGQIPAAK